MSDSGSSNEMLRTIVTGRRVVVDKETGKIIIDEGEQEAAGETKSEQTEAPQADASSAASSSEIQAEAAPSSEAPTAEQPIIVSSPELEVVPKEEIAVEKVEAPAAVVEAPAAVVESTPVPDSPPVAAPVVATEAPPPVTETPAQVAATEPPPAATEAPPLGGNKRLSAETLFAFALPEAVLNEAVEKYKSDAAMNNTLASFPQAQGKSGSSTAKNIIYILALLAVLGLLALGAKEYLLPMLKGGEELEAEDGEDLAADSEESNDEETVAARETAKVVIPADPITPVQAGEFSAAQLALALQSLNDDTLLVATKEVIKRKDQSLVSQMLALSNHKNYQIRVALVKGLADPSIYSKELEPAVLKVLLERVDDEDELVRGFSAKALGATKNKTVLTKLNGRLDVERSDVVLRMIRSAIDELERAN